MGRISTEQKHRDVFQEQPVTVRIDTNITLKQIYIFCFQYLLKKLNGILSM